MTGIAARVLVVDDEPQILRALRAALTGHGYEVQTADNGDEALDTIAVRPPDVVILDLVMPGKSGFEVVQDVRTWSHVPIVVLSARGQERDKVTALDLGADDYLTKPFGMDELLARIRVALRHRVGTSDDAPIVHAGNVTIDLAGRAVTRDGALIHLTPTEWRLLAELARNADRVLTHGMLLTRVWGPMFTEEPQYLRVFINQLRRKLEVDPAEPRVIATEPGVGYRLVAEE
jgi:two-component system KDP operon response regulator KdpE